MMVKDRSVSPKELTTLVIGRTQSSPFCFICLLQVKYTNVHPILSDGESQFVNTAIVQTPIGNPVKLSAQEQLKIRNNTITVKMQYRVPSHKTLCT